MVKEPFTCMLCDRSGRKTLAPRARRGWAICEDCAEAIETSGRCWCNPGLHIVEASDWRRGGCKDCRTRQTKAYRQNPDVRARQYAINARWKQNNREQHLAYQRRYRREGAKIPLPPKGFITVKELARRVSLEANTIRERLRNGWAVNWVRMGRELFIEDRQSYPPMPGKLGPAQRALLAELEYPKATKALAHGRPLVNVRSTLYKLRKLGLVEQVSFGVWGRV